MRQEGGRSGRAGRNMPCDGLQDGTTPHMSFLRSNASEMQIATGFYMLVIGVRAGGERDGRGGRNITITRFLRANVPNCRHRGWKAIRGHISEGLGCVCVAGPHIQAYQSLGYIRGTLSERHL